MSASVPQGVADNGVVCLAAESLTAITDEALVERMRAGDTSCGEALVRRHYQSMLRYLQRLCGNDQLAEELQQQAWLSVLEHLPQFDASSGDGGFKAWLFRIATNKANDFWRSNGRERAAKEGLKLLSNMDMSETERCMDGSEQAQRLRLAIEQLPENQRQVLLLRYYGDMKFVDIAKLIGCPLNTALGRMHKAMLKLKCLLEA